MNIIFCVSLMANDLITTSQIYSINAGIHILHLYLLFASRD